MRRAALFLASACGLSLAGCTRGDSSWENPLSTLDSDSATVLDVDGSPARIQRDSYGVPHISAQTNRGLFVAYGYAVAQDRLWQLETYRRSGRGRLAEVFGEAFVPADTYSRLVGYRDSELEAQFNLLDEEERALFDGYVEGINRYIREVVIPDPLDKLPFEFHALGVGVPQPYSTSDLTSLLVVILRQFGEIGGNELANQRLLDDLLEQHGEAGYGVFNDARWLNDPDAPVSIPVSPAAPVRTGLARPPLRIRDQLVGPSQSPVESLRERAVALWESVGVPTRLGSYAWVVSPEKSANGRAMLYGGPQMGFNAPEIIHEVELNSGEGFHVVGLTLAGAPGVIIGHNRNFAWTLTTGAAGDNLDIYRETLCQGGYRYQGACVDFDRRLETISVRGGQPVSLEVLRTVHGPVTSVAGGFAFSQKRAHWMREIVTASALSSFDRARNLGEFQFQVQRVNLSFNVLYADREGNIAYFLAGLNPVRPAGYDLRLPFPGEGDAEWTGDNRGNPFSINPARGWLANWNNKPSPDYDSGDTLPFGKIFRVNDLFARLADGPISREDMEDIPRDIARVKGRTGRESRFLKPYLLRSLEAVPPANAVAARAKEVIEAWDGSVIEDAVESKTVQAGEVIFSAWLTRMLNDTFANAFGSHLAEASSNVLLHALDFAFEGISGVPPSRDYFECQDPNVLMSAAFHAVVSELAAEQGTDPFAWTGPRGNTVFSHPILGEVARIPLSNRSTYGQVIFLSPRIRGENIFTLGQSGFVKLVPPSGFELDPHFLDLLPLYRNFQYKPMGIRGR